MIDDYEWLILEQQDAECDECTTCPYKGVNTCKNQCEDITEIYNDYIRRYL